jgi:hypothetical protein
MADRKRIKEQALAYYEEIATEARSRPSGLRA